MSPSRDDWFSGMLFLRRTPTTLYDLDSSSRARLLPSMPLAPVISAVRCVTQETLLSHPSGAIVIMYFDID